MTTAETVLPALGEGASTKVVVWIVIGLELAPAAFVTAFIRNVPDMTGGAVVELAVTDGDVLVVAVEITAGDAVADTPAMTVGTG